MKPRKKRREVPLTEDTKKALLEQREAFRKKFGRDPGPNDPVFFDRNLDEPRPMTEAQITEQMVTAMERAGTRPEIIHALPALWLPH